MRFRRRHWGGEPPMSKSHYFFRRIAYALLTGVVVISFNFILFRILPGDPARLLLPRGKYSAAALEAQRHVLHLDHSLWQQFFYYWWDTLHLRFGTSFVYKTSVASVVASRIGPTLLLVGTAVIIAMLIGCFTGVIAAWRRGGKFDVGFTAAGMVFYSMPTFWFALLCILAFSVKLHWVPVGRMTDPGVTYASWASELGAVLRHMILPVGTLAIAIIGEYHIITRSSIVGVMKEDYALTARAKGLSERAVLWKHVVPNGMLPTVTVVMMGLGFVLSGAILSESVFNWPGLGLLSYESITQLDYPVMQAVFLIASVAVIVCNLAADIIYFYLDPRVQA
jgi:peptide/nickel transport system permease protein